MKKAYKLRIQGNTHYFTGLKRKRSKIELFEFYSECKLIIDHGPEIELTKTKFNELLEYYSSLC
jgi:hypothetical protein